MILSLPDMVRLSDEFLYQRVKSSDNHAFDELYARYWKRLFEYAYKLVQDQIQAEDIVQEVFVQLWENSSQKEIHHLSGYLFRSVKYQVATLIRNNKWKVEWDSVEMEDIPDENQVNEFSKEELFQLLEESIEKLPPKCKEVFRLHKKEGFSTKEIAHSLNISPRTVENQIQKAMNSLRSDMGLYFFFLLAYSY